MQKENGKKKIEFLVNCVLLVYRLINLKILTLAFDDDRELDETTDGEFMLCFLTSESTLENAGKLELVCIIITPQHNHK